MPEADAPALRMGSEDSVQAARPGGDSAVRTPGLPSPRVLLWSGLVLAVAIAILSFSRFSIDSELSRDEAVYAYGGQQLAEGVPPYVSIAAQKTPVSIMVAGVAVAGGRTAGVDDVHAIRWAFFLVACLTVAAVYFAGVSLFSSPVAAMVGVAAFVAFRGFALDALGGPNAKTPGVLFAVLATALLARRQWFWGAIAAALATLVWQPLVIYSIVAVVAAWLGSDRALRWRNSAVAVAGGAIPASLTIAYLFATGALDEFVQSAVLLPITGRHTAASAAPGTLDHILDAVRRGYGVGQYLFWGGMLLLAVVIAWRIWGMRQTARALGGDPLISVVLIPLLFLVAFSLVDFQGYSDLFPLLPYAALGVAGAVSAVIAVADSMGRRPVALVLAGAGVLFLAGATWTAYGSTGSTATDLVQQRRDAREAAAQIQASDTIYALGDPTPLVLLQRRNPSRFIYLASGVDRWLIDRTPMGFDGWTREIAASDPKLVFVHSWHGEYAQRMKAWLGTRMQRIRVGTMQVFRSPALIGAWSATGG